MTETREQWIEREARRARERYWGSIGDWDDDGESIRQDWRNVVAPYYPEPLADADTLEKLVEIAANTYMEHPNIGNDPVLGRAMMAAVSAVLKAAKPRIDYEQVSIAFSECMSPKEWAEYINSRIRYHFELPQPEPLSIPFDGDSVDWQQLKARVDKFVGHDVPMNAIAYLVGAVAADTPPLRVPVDVDGLADAIRCADSYFWTWDDISESSKKGYRKCARAALAYLNIEPCDKPEYDPVDVALTPTPVNITAEGVDPSRMVFSINGEHLVPKSALDEATAKAERQRQALDANRKTIESRGAEIARLENEVKRMRTQRREWSSADVEELAKELALAYHRGVFRNMLWEELGVDSQEDYRREARAALAWFDGKRGEV